jgi:peptide-methionine (R)-S-oxide reductase
MAEQTEQRTEQEWQQELSPERYAILRKAGTEPPFSGELLDNKRDGVYTCAACSTPLFATEAKFESGSGWPSFFEAVDGGNVELIEDRSHGMRRTEVRCGTCNSHLGHVFDDGPRPTGQRYCINSLALEFDPSER